MDALRPRGEVNVDEVLLMKLSSLIVGKDADLSLRWVVPSGAVGFGGSSSAFSPDWARSASSSPLRSGTAH